MQKNKIKICYVTTIPLTIEMFILGIAEYLYATEKYEITFICNYDEQFEGKLPTYFNYIPVKMKRGIDFTGISSVIKLYRIFKTQKFDLVQYSTPNASFYSSLASRFAKISIRLYCQWGIAYVGFKGFKRKIFKIVEKIICLNSTCVEPDSYGNLEFSITEGLYNEKKGHVIGDGSASGVDFEKFNIARKFDFRKKIRFELGYLDEDIVIGFVGRLDKDKGINELLQAYKEVQQTNIKLLIIGSDDKKESLNQELYQWSTNQDSINYINHTPVVEEYLSAMDIFVLPSYREGFGSVVIEASAMKLPVIVTNIPGPTEGVINGETGIYVRKADFVDLANALKSLIENENLREKYAENGYRFVVNRFEKNQLFKKILQDRESLLNDIDL